MVEGPDAQAVEVLQVKEEVPKKADQASKQAQDKAEEIAQQAKPTADKAAKQVQVSSPDSTLICVSCRLKLP